MRHPVVAAILGLVLGFIIVSGIEALAHLLFPPPFLIDIENMEEYMNKIPLGNMLLVILAHLLGGAVAIFTILKLANKKLPAYVIAVLFFAATIFNLFIIPHTLWFIIADVTVTILGMVMIFKFIKLKEEPTPQ